MTVAFIIAEYNPFHSGHAYHIDKTREALKPDAVVCVMSGHFTQRGSAAVVDKWTRARMALRAGADLVLELHPVYACSSAEQFARGALATASGLGCGGWLSFGAEYGDTRLLGDFAQILNEEPERFKTSLAASLGRGASFAGAREKALLECYANGTNANMTNVNMTNVIMTNVMLTYAEAAAVLRAPNCILAIEYIRAIKAASLPFEPFAVNRYFGTRGDYTGATQIRDELRKNRSPALPEKIADALPPYSKALLESEFLLGRGPIFDEMFFQQIKTIILREDAGALRNYRDVSEGLENRIYGAALTSRDYGELVASSAAKRYPASRIRRILTRALLGFTNRATGGLDAGKGPPYLHALGFTSAGRRLLNSRNAILPAITNYKRLLRADARSREFMRLESRATDVYATAFQNPAFRVAGQDFTRGPAVL